MIFESYHELDVNKDEVVSMSVNDCVYLTCASGKEYNVCVVGGKLVLVPRDKD